jgi:hypothetical protein
LPANGQPEREKDTLTFEFFDAGHVLGSTGVMLRAEGQTVFYTGDVNFDDQTIMQAAVFPEEKIRCADHGMHARRSRETLRAGRAPVKSDAWRRRSQPLSSVTRAC